MGKKKYDRPKLGERRAFLLENLPKKGQYEWGCGELPEYRDVYVTCFGVSPQTKTDDTGWDTPHYVMVGDLPNGWDTQGIFIFEMVEASVLGWGYKLFLWKRVVEDEPEVHS